MHDFADKELGEPTLYQVYDVTANTGWVNVGTGQFAVESIRRWWNTVGRLAYTDASRVQRQPTAAVEDRADRLRRVGWAGDHGSSAIPAWRAAGSSSSASALP